MKQLVVIHAKAGIQRKRRPARYVLFATDTRQFFKQKIGGYERKRTPLRYVTLALAIFSLSLPAHAAPTVSEQIMQKGQFAKPKCQSDPKSPDYDECICDADIRYPQIGGMEDGQTQAKLNDWFKQQAAKTVCEGEQMVNIPAKSERSHMFLSVHYEVKLSSPRLLAFKFTDWAYTGGAHGNGSVIGVAVDLGNGKLLSATDLFSGKNMDAVNKAIYDALAARPEEEIFRDQIEARKGAFIKDGECQGCTLVLTPEGVHVLFQTYEVAPYGAGNTDVLIPAKYITYETVKDALSTLPSSTKGK